MGMLPGSLSGPLDGSVVNLILQRPTNTQSTDDLVSPGRVTSSSQFEIPPELTARADRRTPGAVQYMSHLTQNLPGRRL